jgi:hypothetical protein
MKLSIKHLKTNEYTLCEEEVPEGTKYGFWRIVEHTGAGWFPWPELYTSEDDALRYVVALAISRTDHMVLAKETFSDWMGIDQSVAAQIIVRLTKDAIQRIKK